MSEDKAWNDELLQNPHAVADKRTRVQNMFAAIAPSYDLNNRLHSLWMDQQWRKKAVKIAELTATDRVVDVACGTGDLALRFANRLQQMIRPESISYAQVLGIDFTFEMLPIARSKADSHVWTSREELSRTSDGLGGADIDPAMLDSAVPFINGDALALPLPDACCDIVSIAFGIRNVQDVPAALKEFHRVLRPGGRVIVLEFSLPTNAILRSLYNFYFRQILPRTATLISGDKTGAYKYLPESVNTFIGREQMITMMNDAGFTDVQQFPLTFGVCVCYRGIKKS